MKLKIVGGEVMRKSIIQGIVILTIALVFSATAKSSLAQCRTVDLANLKSYPVGEDISIIKDPTNEWAYRFNENPDAAKRLLSILQAYKVKTICHVPGSGDSAYGYDYESIYDVLLLTENGQPIKGNLLPKSEPEQCVSFKPSALHVIYSDSEQAQVLTDGSVILESSSLYTEQLKQAMSMIQQYSLDTKCNFYFGYYKSQHPLETKTISNTTNAFQLYGTVAPLAALDDRTLRGEVAAIKDQTTAMMRLVVQEINARAIKWPPNPHDPIVRELLARESIIQTRVVSVYSRPRSAREPQGLKTFGELRPLAKQLHKAVETLMRSRDSNSGNAGLKQIASIVQTIKAKASEIK